MNHSELVRRVEQNDVTVETIQEIDQFLQNTPKTHLPRCRYDLHLLSPELSDFAAMLAMYLRDNYIEPSDYYPPTIFHALRYLSNFATIKFGAAEGAEQVLFWLVVGQRLHGERAERVGQLIADCAEAL